ncbi:hypothetical protein EDD18DRAFT_1179751 [Armillaria luteobubalina]|uniref:Uncharacterized protein n=1 Tax=Armillaria luteobubalina TaxID=153913 RepID=A0AA39Q067_9AGAR|nr:hypothetical protein EDD18DRAFT_1179751 [Armillaria luteobubalina]
MVRNPSDRVSLTSSDDLARWLYHFLSIRLELPADQRALRSGNPDYHGMRVEDMIMKDFGSQVDFQRYLKERFGNLKRALEELTSLEEMDKHIKLMETEIRRPLNNFLDCVKKGICAESAVLTITERVFSLYNLDAQWEAMKELNRLFALSHPWLKHPIYSQDSVSATERRKIINNILKDYGAFKNASHPQPRPPQEIRIAPMSPDVAQPGYRALPGSESDYPPSTMPRTTVNRSKKQEVTKHTQVTLRPGSTQPGRMPREGQSTKPSATDVPRTIDRPDTDSEKPSPPNRDRREAVPRPMSTPPKLSREQTERMAPYAVPERIRRVERRSEESPLSSQDHTMLLNRPEIPTRDPTQRTRAPLKHASSPIREAAPAAPMDDVDSERNVTGPVINDQHGSYLKGTGRYNDQPRNVGLPPEPYGHGNSLNRDDDMRILDEPCSRLLADDQVQTHVQISATGGFERSTGAELWASSSDIPIQQGLDPPDFTESPPPSYEAVLQQSQGIESVENLLGSNNETHPSSAYGRRLRVTAPEPPWDAELVAEFRRDPPGIVGHKFLLDRITDACEYMVLEETNRRFHIRAKYNGQQMVQKLRYSELDIGLNVVVRDVQAYFDANPHQVRGAKLRVTGNDEKYRISAFYLEDGIRWFEITQRLTYGEMLRMIRLSRRWDMSL